MAKHSQLHHALVLFWEVCRCQLELEHLLVAHKRKSHQFVVSFLPCWLDPGRFLSCLYS